MASVQTKLSEIYNPTIFDPAVQEAAIELNRFLQSGVMARDPRIDAMASGPGNIGHLPFYKGITHQEPNYITDAIADVIETHNVTSANQIYMAAYRAEAWSTMDLAREIALEDPLAAITNRIGKFWAVDTELRLINSLLGVLADNVANDSGDMVNDISNAANPPAAANSISAEAVIDAAITMGDHAQNLSAIAMHSVIYANLQKLNLIDFIPDARGEVNIPTYLGYRVIVDDSIAPDTGGTYAVYTTILFAPGAVAYGEGTMPIPSEVDRAPAVGYGGGQDLIYSRRVDVIHPWGFSFNTAGPAGQSATYAELAAAAQWDRVYAERKNVGIAFLKTNG